MMGFGELAGAEQERPDSGVKRHEPRPGDVIFGLDARKMAQEELEKAMLAGDQKKIADIQRYIEQVEDAASKPWPENAPLPPAAKREAAQPFHRTENPVQFFGPEVSAQVREAGEQLRQEKEKKKGGGGWFRRLFGR